MTTSKPLIVSSILLPVGDNVNDLSPDCPIFSIQDIKTYEDIRYWVGGVGVCLVSLIGLVLNSFSIFVSSVIDMFDEFFMLFMRGLAVLDFL